MEMGRSVSHSSAALLVCRNSSAPLIGGAPSAAADISAPAMQCGGLARARDSQTTAEEEDNDGCRRERGTISERRGKD